MLKELLLGSLVLASEGATKVILWVDTPKTKIIGAIIQNDETALQPAIQFDEALKCNVGLKQVVDLNFIKTNPTSLSEFLRKKCNH